MLKSPPQEKQWLSWLYVVAWTLIIFVTIPLARTIQKYVYQEWNRDLFRDGVLAITVLGFAAAAFYVRRHRRAVRSNYFWLIAIAMILNHNHVGILQSQVPYLSDSGFSAGITAAVVSGVSLMCTLGMFFFGWLCDRISAKFASIIGLCFIALGIFIFINIGEGSPAWMIVLYAVIFGFGVGSWLPTMSMLTSYTFGLAAYGSIFGMLSFFQNLGAATGPLLAGFLYDSMNTYQWAFIIILAMVVLAIPLILMVRRP